MATQQRRIVKCTSNALCSWCGDPINHGDLMVTRYGILTPEEDGARDVFEYGCYYHMDCDTALIRSNIHQAYRGAYRRGTALHRDGDDLIAVEAAKDERVLENDSCCYWRWGYVRKEA